jgi:alkylation response protein AidB-like acyl-CoA dehydrogenase
MLLVPMKQPGVEVRPLRQMTGEAEFNEVFFTNARVPRDWVIGEVNDGWRAATGLLAHERSSLGKVGADETREASGSAAVPFHYLCDLAMDTSRNTDPLLRQDLARAYTGEKVMGWLGQRSVHPSVGKLWRTKQARFVASLAAQMSMSGAAAHVLGDKDSEFWMYHILNSPRMSLGGGTDEIQKNTIGERALGLPREPS